MIVIEFILNDSQLSILGYVLSLNTRCAIESANRVSLPAFKLHCCNTAPKCPNMLHSDLRCITFIYNTGI